MDFIEILSRLWPIFLGFITLVIVLAKLDNRVAVLEDKVKTIYDLWNKKAI